jgi:hypothetical protein
LESWDSCRPPSLFVHIDKTVRGFNNIRKDDGGNLKLNIYLNFRANNVGHLRKTINKLLPVKALVMGSEISVQGSMEGFKIFPAKNQNTFVEYKKVCGFDKAWNSHDNIQYFFQGWCQSPWFQCTPLEETIHDAPSAQRLTRLTVHHSITLVDLQLDAQNSCLFT